LADRAADLAATEGQDWSGRIMTKRIEYMIGQEIGDHGLIYLGEAGKTKSGVRKARFRCRCGKEFASTIKNVKRGITTSCGCEQRRITSEHCKIKYTIGQEIGDHGLIYLGEAGKTKSGERKARFRCRCGKEFVTTIYNVKTGSTRSCGCEKVIQSSMRISTYNSSRAFQSSEVQEAFMDAINQATG